ncbi:hypothetical protein Bealeia1_01813 [Candidatus Bealeia paramacronuclearis]|uniref:Uncharacterized protein n=1 Tax=Candidatus Bealeia paramacronuclearis TaxID=1921001 RepID=A0ABZ2C543_9PROT|nr:hypothetical protein [Candidatus Bealeia paramacronuclearis]
MNSNQKKKGIENLITQPIKNVFTQNMILLNKPEENAHAQKISK